MFCLIDKEYKKKQINKYVCKKYVCMFVDIINIQQCYSLTHSLCHKRSIDKQLLFCMQM